MTDTDLSEKRWLVPQAARVYGIHRSHAGMLVTDGIVPIAGTKKKKHNEIDIRGMLAMGLALAVRRQGHSLQAVTPIVEFLRGISPADLISRIDAGETIIVAAGEVMPANLYPPGGFVANRAGYTVCAIVIDAGHCLGLIRDFEASNQTAEQTANA